MQCFNHPFWIWLGCRKCSKSFGLSGGSNCLGWSHFCWVFSPTAPGHNELIKRRAKAPRSTPRERFKRFTRYFFLFEASQHICFAEIQLGRNILEDIDWQFWDQFPVGALSIFVVVYIYPFQHASNLIEKLFDMDMARGKSKVDGTALLGTVSASSNHGEDSYTT